jgi:hypothetical protein
MYVKSPEIVTGIKIRKLEWLGHVIRIEDTSKPKTIFNTKPEERRRMGRSPSSLLSFGEKIPPPSSLLSFIGGKGKYCLHRHFSAYLSEISAKF